MILDTYNCEICLPTEEETVDHLFWACPFAQQCWGILNLEVSQIGDTFTNILALKDQLNNQFFMIAIILMCWTIWTTRNGLVFNNRQMGIQECRNLFFKEIKLVSIRVKVGLSLAFDRFEQWMHNLQNP